MASRKAATTSVTEGQVSTMANASKTANVVTLIMIALLAIAIRPAPVHGGQSSTDTCGVTATPVASPAPDTASPTSAEPTLDLAWLTFQGMLASTVEDLATMPERQLDHPELAAFADASRATAQEDLAAIATLLDELAPAAGAPSAADLLAVLDQARQALDLPAGQGSVDALSGSAGIARICAAPPPHDELYLAAAIDLAQRQIDLAEVAIIGGSDQRVIELAQSVKDREESNLAHLYTWQETWFGPGTPAAG